MYVGAGKKEQELKYLQACQGYWTLKSPLPLRHRAKKPCWGVAAYAQTPLLE